MFLKMIFSRLYLKRQESRNTQETSFVHPSSERAKIEKLRKSRGAKKAEIRRIVILSLQETFFLDLSILKRLKDYFPRWILSP